MYYVLSDGDKNQIDAFKATDIMEFFSLLMVREEVIKEKIKQLENAQS